MSSSTAFPEYPKINGVFKRNKDGRMIEWNWATPEFGLLEDAQWRWTEKIDGTNIRVRLDPKLTGNRYTIDLREAHQMVTIGGRTDNAQIPASLANHLNHLFSNYDAIEATVTDDLVLYGEGYGGSIQKMGEVYGPDPKFILFDVWVPDPNNRLGGYWLYPTERDEIAAGLGLQTVHTYGTFTLRDAIESIQAGGFNSRAAISPILRHNSRFALEPEGLVGTPVTQLFDRRGHRVQTKIKKRDYGR